MNAQMIVEAICKSITRQAMKASTSVGKTPTSELLGISNSIQACVNVLNETSDTMQEQVRVIRDEYIKRRQ